MSSRKEDPPSMQMKETLGSGLNYQGLNSCQSCLYTNYNGNICGQPLSPNAGKKVTPKTWCRYWAPKSGRNILL